MKSKKSALTLHRTLFGWVLMALASLLYSHTVLAQSSTYLHAGLNLSTIRAGSSGVNLNKLNFIAGLGLSTDAENDRFYFGAEVNFAQKGNRTTNVTPGTQIEQTRANLFYLQVPGYIGYRFDDHWSTFLGPCIGVLLYNSEENMFTINSTPTDFTTIEISALGGIKYAFGNHFGAMLRAEHSVSSIVNVERDLRQLTGARRFHALIGISLYYSFD
jgi:hypothetical protein